MTCITNTPSPSNHLISKGYGPTLQSHLHADALSTVCKLIPTQNAHPTNPNPPLFNKQPPHLSTPPNFSCTNPTLPPHSEDQMPTKRNILFITTDQMRLTPSTATAATRPKPPSPSTSPTLVLTTNAPTTKT
jgi:hypothetical protein